ncbi:hypoxia induced protein conserved region-domain-containing protein [Nemania sp. NC0429]|nr:hypoxia induced protein conserved region-domain-containing protein [Nemania sp. NC0429]
MADRPLPSSFDEDAEYQENAWQKISRKLREEPLVPLGAGLVCLALYNASRALRRGDHEQLQRAFRARIAAQAFTVLAMVGGGAYYGADREKRKELVKLEAQQRAEERNQKWLRELEVRDDEDKKLQAAMRRKRDRLEQKRADDEEKSRGRETAGEGGKENGNGNGPQQATAAAAADADAASAGGSSVLAALSSAGGWFWTKREPADKTKAEEAEVQKK